MQPRIRWPWGPGWGAKVAVQKTWGCPWLGQVPPPLSKLCSPKLVGKTSTELADPPPKDELLEFTPSLLSTLHDQWPCHSLQGLIRCSPPHGQPAQAMRAAALGSLSSSAVMDRAGERVAGQDVSAPPRLPGQGPGPGQIHQLTFPRDLEGGGLRDTPRSGAGVH